MEGVYANEESCFINELETSLPKIEISPEISMHTLSSWDSVSQMSNSPCDSIEFKDPFEGIFYRTQIYETNLHIQFVSNAFFGAFRWKIHSDFMNSIDIDETNFISSNGCHYGTCDF